MVDPRSLVSQEHELIKGLCNASQCFSSPTTLIEKEQGYTDLLNALCEYIINRYPNLVIEEALKPSSAVANDPLNFLHMHLELLTREKPLKPDFVKWLITRLIITSISEHLEQEVSAKIRKYIGIFFTKLLHGDEQQKLVLLLINQMKECKENEYRNWYTLWEDDEEVEMSYASDRLINLEGVTSLEKDNALTTLIQLLAIDSVSLDSLDNLKQIILWVISIDSFSRGTIELKCSCLLLWTKLFAIDAANWMICRVVVDRVLQMESHQTLPVGSYDSAKAKFFEVLSGLLVRFDETTALQGIDLKSVILWAERCITVFLETKHKNEKLLNFARTACQVLTSADLHEDDWKELANLRLCASKIVSYYFTNYCDEETDELLEPFVSFLLLPNGSEIEDDWISYVKEDQCGNIKTDIDRLILSKKFIAVLQMCKNRRATNYLEKLAPSQETIIKFVEDANRRGDVELLLTLLTIVSDLAMAECISPTISLPFLSLPWYTNDVVLSAALNRRHHSIPTLKDFTKFSPFIKRLSKEKETEAKISTLPSLTKISKHSEWRRQLFTVALKDKQPKVAEKALAHMHEFLFSVGNTSLQFLAEAALEVTVVPRDVVMSALARCICASDLAPEAVITVFKCDICSGSDRKPNQKNEKRLEAIPEPVLRLAMDTWKLNKTSLGSLKLTSALLFHYPAFIPESRLIETFAFMENCEEEVRELYLHLFKYIISSTSSMEISALLQDKLPFYQTKHDNVIMDSFSANYLTICAEYAKDKELSNWAVGRHYSIILQSQEILLMTSMRNLVRDIAHLEDISTTRVFARRIRIITKELCSHLISFGKLTTPTEVLIEEMTNALELTRKMFFFEDVAGMLKIGAKCIVPTLLMCNPDERPWVIIVLEKIREETQMQKDTFGQEFFPLFMVQWILQKGNSYDENDSKFLTTTFGASMLQLTAGRRYFCTQYLLQNIATNEEVVLKGLANLNEPKLGLQTFTLTKMMLISCEYVGHFLRLRWSLTVDEFFEQRPILLKSLELIIQRLDEPFLEDVANRLMSVLRAATQVGEAAIPVWIQFAQRLNRQTFRDLLPRILIDTQPLLQYDSSDSLISVILGSGASYSPEFDCTSQDALEREIITCTTFVLIGCDSNGAVRLQKYLETIRERDRPVLTNDKLINTCVRLLSAECETVGKVVLQKLHSLLDGHPLSEELTSNLIPALFQTLRRCADPETRLLTVKCIGRLGAVDPGRLEIAHTENTSQTNIFVDDKDDFLVDLIERSWKAYSRETEFVMFEQIEYSIQELLTRAVGKQDEARIMSRLSTACRKDILPLKSTQLTPRNDPSWTAKSPIVNNVENFSQWLQQCFVMGATRVRQDPIRHVFRALKWIANTRDTLFTRYILPQLILRLIIENDAEVLELYTIEMETVLRHVVEGGESWVHLAAHIVFSILDTLEQFAKHRKTKKKGTVDTDPELRRTLGMINVMASKTIPDGQLLIVVAAEKCNCFYRALKWCEQFAISSDEESPTDRQAFFTLERLYTSLHNVDGVLGAFECLSKSSPPSAHEKILMLEAIGDYHEAMALYAILGSKKEPEMVKCLLRLNQPQLALCTAKAAYASYLNDECMSDILYANQVEAACLLQDWKQLDSLVEKRDPLTLGKRTTWGASCASILCAVKREEEDILTSRLQAARELLVDQLTAMTIEHSDTYTQAYNYVTQLHILDEIEDSSEALHLLTRTDRPKPKDLKAVLAKWQVRSENAIQGASSLESILSVRRELLKLHSAEDSKENITQLLIQSCRLARQAGHLQIAWTFLVEAQSLDVCHKEVGMEQARFEFQKGDQQQAISHLTKLLNGRFSKMTELFQQFVIFVENSGRRNMGSDKILTMPKNERASFAEIQLLRAEYMLKAGSVSCGDLYKIYMAIRKINVPSEDLFYRIALFCDGMYTQDQNTVRSDLVVTILKTYADALRYGRNHLFHAMPRMLTLWLDCTQKKYDLIVTRTSTNHNESVTCLSFEDVNEKDKQEINKMNNEMQTIFKELDSYYFYKAFPQLISRIEHKCGDVFNTLKIILADLIVKYPHQCLWQSMAVYRTTPYEKNPCQKRCSIIYGVAKTRDKRLETLIDQYDFISSCLIRAADQKTSSTGTSNDLDRQFPQLYDFFATGVMHLGQLMGAKERKLKGIKKVQPAIMVPLTEMMDHAIPKHVEHQLESFSQIVINPEIQEEPTMGALPEVLIHKFETNYMVLKSLMQPKRLTIRSQDGRQFQIMVKPGDELRKDARFMDVNRMMNSLMRQNPESRRRQLNVRTYTVLPLQPNGGILEWVPNLIGYRYALQPFIDDKVDKKMTDSEWFRNWDGAASVDKKLEKIKIYYKAYPLVMAEWFRKEFVDPSSWHAARTNYARSAAVMSMIGFILGLGDRHGENIQLDQKDGSVVHVDFNLIFNKGEQLPVKEIVPFRLTRNMVNGLGPTGVEGTFRKSCEATLKVMRDNKETLLTVVQAFVHDPLLEWQDSTRAQQHRARNKGPPALPKDLAADAVALIGKRLEGHIVTPEVYRLKFNVSPMSLEGQVNKLIEIATNEKLLVQMYIGWAPFM